MKWEKVSLENISTRIGDGLHGTPKYDDSGEYFFINGNNLSEGKILIKEDTKRISSIEYDKIKKDLTDKSILVAINGTLGNIGLYQNEPVALGKSACYINVNNNVEKLYIRYVLENVDFQRYALDFATGSTIKNLGLKAVRDYSFNLPPLPIQRKIASILSAYDDLIENNLKRIKLLEEKAFVEYKLLDKVAKHKLSDLYDTSSGGTPSRTNAEYFTGEINWFKSKELADSILLESEEKITEGAVDKSSAKLFPAGSVIMAMYGATIGKLGLLSKPSTTNQACCAIIEKDDIRSNYYILNWLLENREYVLSFRMGAAQENISQQVIKNLLVSIPNASDLKIFNSEMKPIYQIIKNLHQQNTKLREARDILLPRLMNGQIEV
jgi:type I restriction enzyme S subunit